MLGERERVISEPQENGAERDHSRNEHNCVTPKRLLLVDIDASLLLLANPARPGNRRQLLLKSTDPFWAIQQRTPAEAKQPRLHVYPLSLKTSLYTTAVQNGEFESKLDKFSVLAIMK